MGAGYGPGSDATPSLRRPASAVARDHAVVEAAVRTSRDPDRVRLEGIHAYKHAVRFGADVEVVCTPDRSAAAQLLATLAPDVALPSDTIELDAAAWRSLVPRPLPSPLLAVARRPSTGPDDVFAAAGRAVVLEEPRHLGNLGAVVRVAAAASAGGVLCVGGPDPWHPTAVRAAAGLHLALPVARTHTLPATGRPVVALDPDGDDLGVAGLPADAVLLVGTERGGLSPELRARADRAVRLPMRTGVSSLNLATAVAAALYGAGPTGGTVQGR